MGEELVFQIFYRPEDADRAAPAGQGVRRAPQAAAAPARLRPHRRPDRQAGHHPAHPRRRARAHLQRVQGPQGRDHHAASCAASSADNIIVDLGRRGGDPPVARAGAARDLPARRPHRTPTCSTSTARPGARRSSSPAPTWACSIKLFEMEVPGDLRGHRAHRGRRPRAGGPRQDRRVAAATRTSIRWAPAWA